MADDLRVFVVLEESGQLHLLFWAYQDQGVLAQHLLRAFIILQERLPDGFLRLGLGSLIAIGGLLYSFPSGLLDYQEHDLLPPLLVMSGLAV
ncbi:hypothetical protein ACE6H2_017409 [Prunus campanulata]